MVVVPRGRRLAAEVKFSEGKNRVLHRAINLVSIDIEVRGKPVILAELFELRKRIRHESRVNDANVCGSFGVGAKGSRFRRRRRVVDNFVDLVQTEAGTRSINVALDVLGFQGPCAGVNLESLHNPRVNATDDYRGNDEHRPAEDGKTPSSDERGHDKEQSNDHGNTRENLVAGDRCGGLRESRSRGEEALRGRHQSVVLVNPQVCGLHQHVQCAKNGNLGAKRLRDNDLTGRRNADTAVDETSCRACE
ncbi:unannotated protein [freshwater metagenome]|uniref:Unannotated protein n=1 Tax=freshwater metagenome TaxID=449393 RepID=A0A6J6IFN6_9ZZZZ